MEFVLLDRQTINGNQRLLFQQTCPSVDLSVLFAYTGGNVSRLASQNQLHPWFLHIM
jgi:hypothetical protein